MMLEYAKSPDGTRIAYRDLKGNGTPILFLHEFAGDINSWNAQADALSPRYRALTYAARGYPPSEVPDDAAYSQQHAVEDALAVLDAAGIASAHLIGISMGGYTAAQLTAHHPERVRSATLVGCGWGSEPDTHSRFVAESQALAARLRVDGWRRLADQYAHGPARIQLKRKNPLAWRQFCDDLATHDSRGSAATMEGVQARRPTLPDLVEPLRAAARPILIVTGDEDSGCLDPNAHLKRALPDAGWCVLPQTGHTLNLEEPVLLSIVLERFLSQVDSGTWGHRDTDGDFSSTGI
ncbi:MAG: alpha/beta hydrolase [Rhodococcus sp. (in: high G+C Gram-positive bacteria)]